MLKKYVKILICAVFLNLVLLKILTTPDKIQELRELQKKGVILTLEERQILSNQHCKELALPLEACKLRE